jgi:hypothetical protein
MPDFRNAQDDRQPKIGRFRHGLLTFARLFRAEEKEPVFGRRGETILRGDSGARGNGRIHAQHHSYFFGAIVRDIWEPS